MGTIGRYNLLISETGQYSVEWYKNDQRYLVMIPDFVDKIHKMVQSEMESRKHFAQLFRLAFSENSSEFINHPDCEIMNYISDKEVVADKKMNKSETLKFNIKSFLLAYNRWKKTSIKYAEVEPLLIKKNMGAVRNITSKQ